MSFLFLSCVLFRNKLKHQRNFFGVILYFLFLDDKKECYFRAYHQGKISLYNVSFDVGIRKHQDIQTSIVCNIFDVDGEVTAGVASVEAIVSCLLWIQLNQNTIANLYKV